MVAVAGTKVVRALVVAPFVAVVFAVAIDVDERADDSGTLELGSCGVGMSVGNTGVSGKSTSFDVAGCCVVTTAALELVVCRSVDAGRRVGSSVALTGLMFASGVVVSNAARRTDLPTRALALVCGLPLWLSVVSGSVSLAMCLVGLRDTVVSRVRVQTTNCECNPAVLRVAVCWEAHVLLEVV